MSATGFAPRQAQAAQTVPYKINFQGRLTNSAGNVMADGQYNIKFRIWTAASGGSNTWTETRETTDRVQVTNGLFSVQLGDVTALSPSVFTTQPLYFEVELPTPATATCSTASCASWTEGAMTPRRPLGSSPYAMNSDTLDGLDSAAFAQLSPGAPQSGALDVTGNIKSGATVQANTLDAATSGALTVGSTNATSISLAKNTTMGGSLTLSLQGNNALNLGSTTAAGGILFNDGTVNARSVTLTTVGLTASYTLSLPTQLSGVAGDCLKDSTGSGSLAFGSCSGTTPTLQAAYTVSTGGTTPEIKLDTTRTGLDIQDADSPLTLGTALLSVRKSNGSGLGGQLFVVDSAGTTTLAGATSANDAAAIGSELFTGNSFNAATGWTAISGTGTSATGTHTAGGGTTAMTTTFTPTAGATYRISFASNSNTSEVNAFTAALGGTSAPAVRQTSGGSLVFVITAASTTSLRFTPTTAYNGTITSVSVKLITTSTTTLSIKDSSSAAKLDARIGGTANTFLGLQSGRSNTVGSSNTSVGSNTLQSNTIGTSNTATGANALQENTTGSSNTANGQAALQYNSTGNYNTGIGNASLQQNTTGVNNTGLGYNSLQQNYIGNNNSAFGSNSLNLLNAGNGNTANGASSLIYLANNYSSISSISGDGSTVTVGSIFTTIGLATGSTVTISGTTNYNGTYTVATASSSSFTYSSAATGAETAGFWTAGSTDANTAVGYLAGAGTSNGYTATGNSLIGYQTGLSLQSGGSYNTIIGYNSGSTLTTGANNILIGNNVQAPSDTGSNQMNIGNVLYGNVDTTAANRKVYVQTTNANAFEVKRAVADSSTVVLSVDTETATDPLKLLVGSASTDTTQINLQLDSFSTYTDAGTCSTTVSQGALYYNTSTNAIRTCVNGGWEDIMTTAGLGLIMFGIVPDSGTTPGDLAGVNATDASDGPCKVYMGSVANSVRWTGCTLYAYGRKQTITAQTSDYTTSITTTASAFQNLCIFSAGAQPTFGTGSATETSASLPGSWSIATPSICLATIKEIAGGSGIGVIYDTRVFTTSTKLAVSLNTDSNIGMTVKSSATVGVIAPTAATTDPFVGVLASYSDSVSSTVVNAIVVSDGQAWVKATAGTVNQYVLPTATSGYVSTSAIVTVARTDIPFNLLGLALTTRNAPGTQCSVTANADTCRGSVLVNVNIR